MQQINFNYGWNRSSGSTYRSIKHQVVDLPDDFIINLPRKADNPGSGSVGYFASGTAVYEKDYVYKAGETILLGLDGAYENAEVFVNGDLIFQHPYGYTGVTVDMTDHLTEGPNHIRIQTTCYHPGSRWYTGGGLFRNVTLYRSNRLYFHPYDVFVTTPEVSKDSAVVRIEATITNRWQHFYGNLHIEIKDPGERTVSSLKVPVELEVGETHIDEELDVLDPMLWGLDTPRLYTARLTLTYPGAYEMHEQSFGIRKIEIDSKNGFRLNGEPMKLRGGCIHHDNGMLGSAAFQAAEERKIRKLKEAGFNAIRTAHNPPSSALVSACDKLGMLVLEESFDVWRYGKNPLDYHMQFEKWWAFDTGQMVRRDRNHPSIFCWSIGNEIMEFDGNSDGVYWGKVQADLVRRLDPTRPVTSGINCACGRPEDYFENMSFAEMDHYVNHVENGVFNGRDLWGEATEAGIANLDIAGYNYHFRRYAMDREKYPDRVIMGTETRPALTWENIQAVNENPNCIGDFVWTAMDNLGEAGMGRVVWAEEAPKDFGWRAGFPWMSCWQGDLDLTGYRLPISYYRNVVWGLDPGVHVFTRHPSRTGLNCYGNGWHWEELFESWTYEEEWLEKPVVVVAYTKAEHVRFLLNGEVMADVPTERCIARAEIPYRKGTLTAVALNQEEAEGYDTLTTAGAPARLLIDAEQDQIISDGQDLGYVRFTIADADGVPIIADEREIHVKVSGGGSLQGLGSGNPCTDENYGTGTRRAFRGSVMAVVKPYHLGETEQPREIILTAQAEGLPSATIAIPVRKAARALMA